LGNTALKRFDFQSPEKFGRHNFNHEIESFLSVISTLIIRSKWGGLVGNGKTGAKTKF